MSKLSFRARALDASKPLPVYHAEDLPDLSEYNIINRAVPEMPTGMEKEEETVRSPLRNQKIQDGGGNMAAAYLIVCVKCVIGKFSLVGKDETT